MLWYFMGVIYLCIMTYQDYTRKMLIDDRYNYLMIGATAMLYQTYKHHWSYLLFVIGLAIILSISMVYLKAFGQGDSKIVLWSFIGFAIINIFYLLTYLLFFMGVYMIHRSIWAIINKMTKQDIKRLPGLPVFLISYCGTLAIIATYG